jgi:uncharacterized protein involved in exopolysaccharide biosynthesis
MSEETKPPEMESQKPDVRSGEVASDADFSLLDLLLVFAKHKVLVLGLPVAAGIVALVVSFLLPNWYAATTKLMPPQQGQSAAMAILGQLGGVTASTGQALGLKNPSDIYVAMLKSRTVADKLIKRFELRKVYGEELLVEARKELSRNSSISGGRDGVISIEVEDKDPKRAADIANGYVDELRELTMSLTVTEAGQRRLFFEGELKKTKNDLATAEIALKKFTQDAGFISPEGQIAASVSAAAALRAHIAAKEIQLSGMRTFATENNPDIKRALQELSGLKSELGKMEQDTTAKKGDVMVPFGKAPELGLEYIRRYRDVKYFETLFQVLAKQFEIAKIDEAKDATVVQVIDTALTPEKKARPKRALITVLAAVAGLVISIGWALVLNAFRRTSIGLERRRKFQELRTLLFHKWAP